MRSGAGGTATRRPASSLTTRGAAKAAVTPETIKNMAKNLLVGTLSSTCAKLERS
jgi:hypothetical protein